VEQEMRRIVRMKTISLSLAMAFVLIAGVELSFVNNAECGPKKEASSKAPEPEISIKKKTKNIKPTKKKADHSRKMGREFRYGRDKEIYKEEIKKAFQNTRPIKNSFIEILSIEEEIDFYADAAKIDAPLWKINLAEDEETEKNRPIELKMSYKALRDFNFYNGPRICIDYYDESGNSIGGNHYIFIPSDKKISYNVGQTDSVTISIPESAFYWKIRLQEQ
jgi:hypothetical protein